MNLIKNFRTKIKNSNKFIKFMVAPFYSSIIFLEITIERILDFIYCQKNLVHDLNEVTIVIKTFERVTKLKRLVKSIRRFYPNLTIIIVDDSKTEAKISGVQLIRLPYNSGVSAGRNAGINAVKTKYTVIIDDDFIFNRYTNIHKAYINLQANPSIDILGGEVIYLPFRIVHDYSNAPLYNFTAKPLYDQGQFINEFKVMLKVPNFYIGKTEKIKKVGWDNQLKRIDHEDFFTRAVGVLTCVQDKSFKVLHDPTHFDVNYLKFRFDLDNDLMILQNKYQITNGMLNDQKH
jgi:glycosyltransferase involved in cell wall biosynthesis